MMEKMQAQMDTCLSMSCSEVTSCLEKFNGGQVVQNKNYSQDNLDKDFQKKMQDKINSCIEEKIRGCLVLDCSEMQSCINELQGSGGGENKTGEGGPSPDLQQEIQTKMGACMKDKGGGSEGGGGGPQDNQQESQNQNQQQNSPPSQSPQQPPESNGGQIPQEYCSGFADVPKCEYVGPVDSQNYKYCKQCFPDK